MSLREDYFNALCVLSFSEWGLERFRTIKGSIIEVLGEGVVVMIPFQVKFGCSLSGWKCFESSMEHSVPRILKPNELARSKIFFSKLIPYLSHFFPHFIFRNDPGCFHARFTAFLIPRRIVKIVRKGIFCSMTCHTKIQIWLHKCWIKNCNP